MSEEALHRRATLRNTQMEPPSGPHSSHMIFTYLWNTYFFCSSRMWLPQNSQCLSLINENTVWTSDLEYGCKVVQVSHIASWPSSPLFSCFMGVGLMRRRNQADWLIFSSSLLVPSAGAMLGYSGLHLSGRNSKPPALQTFQTVNRAGDTVRPSYGLNREVDRIQESKEQDFRIAPERNDVTSPWKIHGGKIFW